jgi:hypothetical protein
MTVGSRTVPDSDLAKIRLVRVVTGYRPSDSSPLPTAWRVEAVMRQGPALCCATGDHESMLDVLWWAGQEWAKAK